jgi:hypothetical protein
VIAEAEKLIEEVQQMKSQYQAEVGTTGRKVWPRSIKERVMTLDKMEIGAKRVAELTGIPYETILQWRYTEKHRSKKQFHEIAVLEPKKKATVTVPDKKSESILTNATVTVTLESGVRIDGPMAAVLALLESAKVGRDVF